MKQLPALVPAGTDVHLASGLYAGPFTLGDDAHLEGHGEVVLHAGPGEVTVRAARGALTGVSVQGGDVGLLVTGPTRLAGVRLSGQRKEAARVEGTLTAEDLVVAGAVEDTDGLVVSGSLQLTRARFSGGLRRAVRVLPGGRASLAALTSEGPKTLLHALTAHVELRGAKASQGSGPAVFLSGGEATLAQLEVRGHEYALQVTSGAKVSASGLVAEGALVAGVAVQQSTLALTASTVRGGDLGNGVQALDATLTLRDVTVLDTRHLGLLVRKGTARLERCRVERVSPDTDALGDALMVRDARVEVDDLRVADVGGSAVFASALAEVKVTRLLVERAAQSALFVERGARLAADSVLVRGGRGPAVLVPDAATVTLGTLSVAGGDVAVYAECDAGARVTIGRLEATQPQPFSRCVQVGAAP